MDPVTALFASINSLLVGINAAIIKPNQTHRKELIDRHRMLDNAYVDYELAMHKLFAQLEEGNYAAATADLMKFESVLDQNFRQIIYLVEEIRIRISGLDIDELAESLFDVAEKCSKIFQLWKQLQVAVIREDHKAIKRLCRWNRQAIKTYVEEIRILADYAEIVLDKRQFKLQKSRRTTKGKKRD